VLALILSPLAALGATAMAEVPTTNKNASIFGSTMPRRRFHSMKSDVVHGVRFLDDTRCSAYSAATSRTTTVCGCTRQSATLHQSPMRHEERDRIGCLRNRGKIPPASRCSAIAGYRGR
jgi:hypothetical protein